MNSGRGVRAEASPVAADLCAQVREIVLARKDTPYLIDSSTGRSLTYGQLASAAEILARALLSAGVSRRDAILVALPNSMELATLYFAALYMGARVVPLNLQLHTREIDFIVRHAEATVAVRSSTTRHVLTDQLLDDLRLPTLELSGESLAWSSGRAMGGPADTDSESWSPFDGVEETDLFSITFTSGTTSVPKAVPHRIDSLLNAAKAFNALVGLGPDTRMLHVLNMAYMAGFLNTLLCPFMAGGTVVLAPQFDAGSVFNFWRRVGDHNVNVLWVSPTILESLLRLDRDPAGPQICRENVHTVCAGTAPLSVRTKREFESKYGVPVLESYGLSELLFIASNARGESQREGSVGKLLAGVELRVLNDAGQEAGRETPGDLTVRTPFMMVGYLDYDTGRPQPLPRDSWFDTGDVGFIADDGNVFITGRKKDIIIRGGVNISPRAIEEVLLQHSDVDDVAVIGVPHAFYGEEVVAALVISNGRAFADVQTSVLEHARALLAAPSVPTRWVGLQALPKNTLGKVQKHKLRESLAAQ